MTDTLAIMQADIDRALAAKASSDNRNNPAVTVANNSPPDINLPYEQKVAELDEVQISRIIEMAWEDRPHPICCHRAHLWAA